MNNHLKYGLALANGCDEVATYMALELAERSWFKAGAWEWAEMAKIAASCMGVELNFGNYTWPNVEYARKQFESRQSLPPTRDDWE